LRERLRLGLRLDLRERLRLGLRLDLRLGLRLDLRLGLRLDLRERLALLRLDLRHLFIKLSDVCLLTDKGIRLIERRESPESAEDMILFADADMWWLRNLIFRARCLSFIWAALRLFAAMNAFCAASFCACVGALATGAGAAAAEVELKGQNPYLRECLRLLDLPECLRDFLADLDLRDRILPGDWWRQLFDFFFLRAFLAMVS